MTPAIHRHRIDRAHDDVLVQCYVDILLVAPGEAVVPFYGHIAQTSVLAAHTLLVLTHLRQEPRTLIDGNNKTVLS